MSQVTESTALYPELGEVAEWSNVPDSKSGVPQGTGGSNPSLSAIRTESLGLLLVKRVDLFRDVPKGNICRIDQFVFLDGFLLLSHSFKATTKLVNCVLFSVVHNLDFVF